MRGDNYKAFIAQLDAVDRKFRKAFEESIADVRSTAQMAVLTAAIERGDIEGAIRAIQLGREFFAPLDAMIETAFNAGAMWQMDQTLPKRGGPAGSLQIRFDGRHPLAEQWNNRAGARLVTEVTDSIKESVRTVVQDGLTMGRDPRKVALDLVGRINRATGRREGGVVGLTSQQSGYVVNARKELEDLSSTYFKRTLRDKRFDRIIAKAIRDGKPLPQADIERITARYSDRLLAYRGQVIARTESLQALNAGRDEGIRQIIEKGELAPDAVTIIWQAAPDRRTRDSHASMNGQRVPQGEAFVTPNGYRLRHPGDTSLGAPASETIQCRCNVRYSVDWSSMAVA